jgi:hypothetical protein
MKEFGENLQRGKFLMPVCTSCGKKAWPPSPICPACLSKTSLKKIRPEGTLVEFADSHIRDHEGIFGIVEMDGFRLVGSFDIGAPLHEGANVRMDRCGLRDGAPYYHFTLQK